MSANSPAATRPDDFLGLKMRIQSSKVLEAEMNALGAVPQVMAFSEVYQALQTGVVDGTENPPSNMFTQKMNEVQNHATVSNHGYLGYAVIVNKKFWDELARRRARRAGKGDGRSDRLCQRHRQGRERQGAGGDEGRRHHRVPRPDRRKSAPPGWPPLLPVHDEMAERIGAETIAAVKAAVGAVTPAGAVRIGPPLPFPTSSPRGEPCCACWTGSKKC